jgi:putative endonuclease
VTRAPRSIGNDWEAFAAQQLRRAGLRIIERSYYCRLGEIDLIALDRDTLVFVEVRYRRSSRFGDPASSVTYTKQQRIIRAARHYLMRHPQYSLSPIRMDVIALEAQGDSRKPRCRWIRDAFDVE